MSNLKLKLAELFSKIREGNKASAQKLLEMMTDTKNERHKIITQLVDTFVKAKEENRRPGSSRLKTNLFGKGQRIISNKYRSGWERIFNSNSRKKRKG